MQHEFLVQLCLFRIKHSADINRLFLLPFFITVKYKETFKRFTNFYSLYQNEIVFQSKAVGFLLDSVPLTTGKRYAFKSKTERLTLYQNVSTRRNDATAEQLPYDGILVTTT